ncbi:MAG: class I SAM-dependent methyltransferase [Anaerofustis stercorihominis]|nr:class I SAM-dependent methyltransferase [Anaerofustis stercorihominis]
MNKELDIDSALGIRTSGRVDSHADVHHHPYEATPYEVLDRIIDGGYIDGNDILADMGCGKGRVSIYLSLRTGCKSIGIEYNKELYETAIDNLHYSGVKNVSFVYLDAAKYKITDETSFFFFNPFADNIFRSVLNNIIMSYYENPREMKLFFYYPDDSYLAILRNTDELSFVADIDCGTDTDRREYVAVYKIEILKD